MRRKVAVVTSTRADYYLLAPIMELLHKSETLSLKVIATGAHLESRFGETWRQLVSDGFTIDARVPIHFQGDTPADIGRYMGVALAGFAEAYLTLKPDLIVVLGDRYEIFSAAAAALPFNIPVAHIHGGEVTEGAIDECFRHAISKMAMLHFAAAADYRDRLIRMGEHPARVYNVGAPGLDILDRQPLLDREQVESRLGMRLDAQSFLVTYHPVTVQPQLAASRTQALVDALDAFSEAKIVITGCNADTGHSVVADLIGEFVGRNRHRAVMIDTLGQHLYLSAAAQMGAVVGNSSSGIIEVPSLGVPTVNIGERQKGRLRAPSVIDCGETASEIECALRRAISPKFRLTLTRENPYGGPGAPRRIVDILERQDFDALTRKPFYE